MPLYATARRYIKGVLIDSLERRGYQLRAVTSSPAAKTVKESQYYTAWNGDWPVFSPWLGHPEFQKFYEGVAAHTIVSSDRCYILMALARHSTFLPGDCAECGVYKGGTALLLSRVLKGTGKRLYLFDSFKGLPAVEPQHDNPFWQEGQFAIDSAEPVRSLLREFGDHVDIRPGWIPQTFAGLEGKRYAFVHLDVDLYRSTLDCLEYFYHRLQTGGVIVFDEYGFPEARGEKDAVDEFFSGKPEKPITLPTGQAFLLKLPSND
jgi:O-methyltransferase